ncbi:MAG: carbohydrate kinase [bacterium]|nr:carbohydrate kinase [bacterium]
MPGGGPMNVAVACARLGVPSAFVGRISKDAHGEAIWAFLRDNGVDLRACQRGPEPTARAIVEHTPRLRFQFEGTGTADTMLTSVEMERLGRGPHILHGGTLGMFRGRTAETLARVAERHPGIVSVDPNVRPQVIHDRARWHHYHQRWLATADIYRASDEDLAWIWPGRSGAECAEELLSGRPSVVFVTHGRSGATVYTEEGAVSAGAESVEVADEVGAGDTFVAAILASLWTLGVAEAPERTGSLELADWRRVLKLATVAAAITCSRPGADPPWLAELPQGVVLEA